MSFEINGLNANSASGNKIKTAETVTKTDGGNATEDKSATSAQAKATVVISPEAKLLSQISSQVDTEAPVDEAKVEAIRAAINDGTYTANAESTAGKLIDIDGLF